MTRVLSIDPGRGKCGVAAMDGTNILARAVVASGSIVPLVTDWAVRYGVHHVLVGDRTGSKHIAALIARALPDVPLTLVAETGSSLDARRRYFRDHPPRGFRRLIPLSLQVPPTAYDDYAAVVLAERYFEHLSINTQ